MTEQEEYFCELLGRLDDEQVATFTLIMEALDRGDDAMSAALQAYGLMPRHDDPSARCEVDFDLLSNIKTICPEYERVPWARALCFAVGRGDQNKVTALQDIMRRRVAS